jgi:prepilin signal peptidase PulO-like enzyme (type II secretory pathway)
LSIIYLKSSQVKKGWAMAILSCCFGAWMGPLMLPLIVLLSSLVGAIIGIILLKIRKENQPFAFGPYIAIAGWIAFYGVSKL